LLSRERAGLGLVHFVLFRSAGLEVDRSGGLAEVPLAMSRHFLEPGSRRKPSPCEERGGNGTREEPLVLNLPKRDARAAPPRLSGRMAPDPRRAIPFSFGFGPRRRMTGPSFLCQVTGSGQLAPNPRRVKCEEFLFQSAGVGPLCQMAGPGQMALGPRRVMSQSFSGQKADSPSPPPS
jgi:hypothetical protein